MLKFNHSKNTSLEVELRFASIEYFTSQPYIKKNLTTKPKKHEDYHRLLTCSFSFDNRC